LIKFLLISFEVSSTVINKAPVEKKVLTSVGPKPEYNFEIPSKHFFTNYLFDQFALHYKNLPSVLTILINALMKLGLASEPEEFI